MNILDIELRLIQSDTDDLRMIVDELKNHALTGYLSLALSPVIGFLAEESHKYLTSRNLLTGSPALFVSFQQAVTKMRALLKLFDDTDGGKEGLVALLELFQQKSSLWMNAGKSGLFGAITKKWLQPDIGLYFLNEDPIYMTIIAFSAIGKTKQEIEALQERDFESISAASHSFGVSIGQYIAAIYNVMNLYGIPSGAKVATGLSPELKITHNDFRSDQLYSKVASQANLSQQEIATAVLFILSQVNVAHVLLPHLLNQNSNLLVRIRFLTAYHAVRSLSSIQSSFEPGLSSLLSKVDISASIPNAKKVRNIFAHYGLGEGTKFIGTGTDPLDDVVQGFSGKSILEVSELANECLHQISEWTQQRFSKTNLRDIRAPLGNHT